MGFYGNITNTSKIQFVFDKTYQNRKQMEENMATDNVYIGRYVLVDYDLNFPGKAYNRLYKYSSTQFYFSPGWEQATRARSSSEPYYLKDEEGNITGINTVEIGPYALYDGEPIYVWDEDKQIEVYYQALYVEGSDYPKFELIDSPSGAIASTNFYYGNYMIDKEYYGDGNIGRGWDSTVWQKVYSDNTEKYVMIAELNSVVPTFDLAIDQPTLNPMTPHFDSDSSSLYYRLHVQPNWGFRIANYDNLSDADKEKYGSDIRVNNSGWNYDAKLKKMQTSSQQYNGAIYFNKDGFDPDYRKVKESYNDEISMKPTGSSGLPYYDRHGAYMNSNSTSTKNDIQELFINLPSIGDTVSEMWDRIYGEGIVTPEDGVYRRNTSMEWDTYAGERLVKETDSGTGYEFTPEQTASIAGAVNSVHDLMGMIIVEDDELPAENALTDHIYYRTKENSIDKGFFIKDLTYEYEESDVSEKQEKVELQDFNAQKYYYKKKNNYYLADEYQTGAQYFSLPQQINEQLLTDYEYKPNTYYYIDTTGSYILASEKAPRTTRNYYVVPEWEDQVIPTVDNKYIFFYPTEAGYFNKFFAGTYNEETKIGSGLFTIDEENKLARFKLEEDNKKVKNLYWWENYVVDTTYNVDNEKVEVFDQDSGTPHELTMIQFESNKYFSLKENANEEIDQNYVILKNQNDIALETPYYTFPEDKKPIQITGKLNGNSTKTLFYEPNTYYYLEGDDYIFAEEVLKLNKTYYNLDEEEVNLVEGKFYEPNKYYYEENGDWALDTNEAITANREYYNIYTRYVIDGAGKFNIGEKWNSLVDKPDDVKLGLRKEVYQWKELKDFARKLNTIHGLIIKINQIMKFDDELTRDTATVQGCINQLKDIINKFDSLKPNKIAVINKYGKIASGNAIGDDWINIDTDNETIQLNHAGPVAGTASVVSNATPTFGSTFEITDYHFDDKGHKYDTTTHTVKIPQGSYSNNNDSINGQKVITKLSLDAISGAIVSDSANLGDVKITESETLNNRLSSLKDDINREIANRITAINEERAACENAIAIEEKARIQADNDEAQTRATKDTELENAIINLNDTMNANSSNLDYRLQSLESKVTIWDSAEQNAKDYADTLADNYDAAGAANNALNSAKEYTDQQINSDEIVKNNTMYFYNITENGTSDFMTLESLFKRVGELEARIVTLEANSSTIDKDNSTE